MTPDRQTVMPPAFVVLNKGMTISETQLIEHCLELIASYKKPKKIIFIDELPRLATGKIDKVKLRAPYWQNQQRQIV